MATRSILQGFYRSHSARRMIPYGCRLSLHVMICTTSCILQVVRNLRKFKLTQKTENSLTRFILFQLFFNLKNNFKDYPDYCKNGNNQKQIRNNFIYSRKLHNHNLPSLLLANNWERPLESEDPGKFTAKGAPPFGVFS